MIAPFLLFSHLIFSLKIRHLLSLPSRLSLNSHLQVRPELFSFQFQTIFNYLSLTRDQTAEARRFLHVEAIGSPALSIRAPNQAF